MKKPMVCSVARPLVMTASQIGGASVCAMLSKAKPKIPESGYPITFADVVLTTPNSWSGTVKPARVMVSVASLPAALPDP